MEIQPLHQAVPKGNDRPMSAVLDVELGEKALTWLLTVPSDRNSRSAISVLLRFYINYGDFAKWRRSLII
ncbi:hypothetical protein ACFLXC_07240 [Chloroflexota bacterium]